MCIHFSLAQSHCPCIHLIFLNYISLIYYVKFYIINVLKLIWQKRIWKNVKHFTLCKIVLCWKAWHYSTYPIMKSVMSGRYQTKGHWNTIGLRFRSHLKLKRKLAVHIFFFKEKLREVEHGAISFPKTLQ